MIVLLATLLAFAPAAQAPRDARVAVTVVDQTGAVIPNAKVTLTLTAATTPAAEPATTKENGVASIAGIPPGRYTIQAEFPGFQTRVLKDVQLKVGDNKHVAVLAIEGFSDSVTVSRDAREAASDRRSTFATAMTREQIEALSDDPDEMAQQLQDIAGGGATIRVDSFEGGRLPPKSMIKAIHITRDAFAAENHFAGGLFIDIITQPGMGPLRTNMNTRFRDGSMSGKLPAQFAHPSKKGPERSQSYGGGLSGTIIKQKASFNLNVNGSTSFDTPSFNYRTPSRETVNTLAPRRPRDNMFLFGTFDYAVTRDQTLRVRYSRDEFTSRNIGVGGWDMLERGYTSEDKNNYLQIQEAGPLGRRFFINTRVGINWSNSNAHSLFEQETVRVIEGFTRGGQQRRGGVRSKNLSLQSDLDYVRGIHSVRTGIQIDGGSYRSNDEQNYIGTYTFEDLDAFLAGTPRSYTRRLGDPNIAYRNLQAGWYLQDDIRVRKGLTLSPGIRYEAQTHLSDVNNFGPRFGLTWSPGKSGKTTLRASAGIFYDWLQTNTYERTLRVNGVRQREVNISNPSYPTAPPLENPDLANATDKYLLSDNLQMQRNVRFSAGLSRTVTRMLSINANYAHTSGDNLMRGLNLNGPVNGARPDPTFANVVQVIGDAESRAHNLNIGANINFNVPRTPGAGGGPAQGGPIMLGGGGMIMIAGGAPPPPPPPGGAGAPNPANARWNWRRMSLFVNLGINDQRNNTDGAFSLPATGRIEDDWGPANFDVRRRLNVGWSSQQLKNFNMNFNFNHSTAAPYTIRSGNDDNADLLFTDRPAGVGRNTARGVPQWNTNAFFTYSWQFGKPVQLPGGVGLRVEGGALTASQNAGTNAGRFRLSLNCQIQNLTNHANVGGFITNIRSADFGKPMTAFGVRRIDFGMGLSF
jgi:hypothetical protein